MEEPIKTTTIKPIPTESPSSEEDNVVEISLISSSDDGEDKQDSGSVQDLDDNEKKEEFYTKKVDPCLLCGQPAVEYDGGGKPVEKEREQAPLFNYGRLFSFLCKGLNINLKPVYGMIKEDWDFSSRTTTPFPFCGSCESLINNLAGVYTRLETVKTELKARIEEGEEVYIKEQLYSKQNVRYFNFRKLVLGAKFQGTVKGRMFQREQYPSSAEGIKHPTCFDESMFPPNHPGSQSQLKTTPPSSPVDETLNLSPSSSPLRKKWKGATCRIPPEVSLSQGSSSTTNSKPATPTFDASRFHRFMKRKPPTSPIKRNPPNLTPVYIPDTSGFMERCAQSGKITYYSHSSGIGTKMKGRGLAHNRKILVFTPTPQNDQYQCTECGQLVPLLQVRKIQQQQLFRHHFLKFHTDCWRCKMCREEDHVNTEAMDKDELLVHLESRHGITDWNEYLKLNQLHAPQ
ncbi:unnamed protein product [Orchesella dallaii]|uniref:Uncharacterized protein n=1 Tax=Orchesella dallaii TaxID=48710 RepID=A0ABP1RUV3_9HEXA